MLGDGDASRRDRPLQAAQLRGGQPMLPGGCRDLGEEGRQVAGRGDLQLLPGADLGLGGPRPMLQEVAGHGLQAARDRRVALGRRPEIAGEEGEDGVPHGFDAG